MSDTTIAAASPPQAPPSANAPASGLPLWSHGSFSFKDLLDIVNPLQHLPVIGSVYRYLTGDEPSGGARIVGDALYGGPIGFGVGVVSTLLTDSQGHDLGERALSAVFGPSSADETAVAQAGPRTTMAAATSAAATGTAATQSPARLPQTASATQLPAVAPTPTDATRFAAQLYRSPPTPAINPNTPQQQFLAQAARFRRQNTTVETADGRTLNNRPVPLELTGNLAPPNRLTLTPPVRPNLAAPANQGPATGDAAPPALNPIAQKMLDALDKYEQLKKQQTQEDNLKADTPAKVDRTL